MTNSTVRLWYNLYRRIYKLLSCSSPEKRELFPGALYKRQIKADHGMSSHVSEDGETPCVCLLKRYIV